MASRPRPQTPEQLALGAYFRAWVGDQLAAGQTNEGIGKRLGVTKSWVIQASEPGRRVGQKLENGFAKLVAGGSIDNLRRAAAEYVAAHPEALAPSTVTTIDPEEPKDEEFPDDVYEGRKSARRSELYQGAQQDVKDEFNKLRFDGVDPDSLDALYFTEELTKIMRRRGAQKSAKPSTATKYEPRERGNR